MDSTLALRTLRKELVYAGPMFERPIPVQPGEVVISDGFAFQDLLEVTPDRWDP